MVNKFIHFLHGLADFNGRKIETLLTWLKGDRTITLLMDVVTLSKKPFIFGSLGHQGLMFIKVVALAMIGKDPDNSFFDGRMMRLHVLHSTCVGFLIAGFEEMIHLRLFVSLFEDLTFLTTAQADGIPAL